MGITDVVGKAPRNAWSLFVAEPALGLLDAVFGGVPAPIVRTAYRLTAIEREIQHPSGSAARDTSWVELDAFLHEPCADSNAPAATLPVEQGSRDDRRVSAGPVCTAG
ncbi:hypothetical protein [Rhodococcus sp. Chr-9]|uniref:hypothetical protein n=1 Tax=Rhodococcus TaxID=1827 RepID=UPI000574E289|nr:hypothetical protein [Rhodococcus sp. Chr-9]KHJ72075.1 hypothetical protein QR64_14450 [Rhodococcus sp. Chr-9]